MELKKDFPSLKLGYEHVKNVLQEQAEIARDYVNRAIALFSVATAIVGIGLPLLFTKYVSQHYFMGHIPLVVLSVVPPLLYVLIIYFFWETCRREFLKGVYSPEIMLTEGYLELEPERFYSEEIQHIESAFSDNERVIKHKAENLIWLIVFLILETAAVVSLALLFFTFRFVS